MSIEYPENQGIPELETLELLEFGGEPDLVSAAIQHAQVALPGWTPRESSTEVVLIESLALIIGVEALSLQSVGSTVVEQLMGLYGVTRHNGFHAEGQVRFQVASSAPMHTIPSGTRLRYTLEESDETIDFLTVEPIDITTSETLFGTAHIEADEPGIEGNGIPEGAVLDLVDPLSFVDQVTVSRQTFGGEVEETDESFQTRAAAVLSRMNSTLVTPANFTAATMSDPRVARALTLDLYDPAGTPKSPVAGHVTIAVVGSDGTALPADTLEGIQATLERQALASLQLHIIQPTITTTDITCTVVRGGGHTQDEVTAQVEAGLGEWLNPKNWDWSPRILQNAIIGKLYELPGVAAVVSVNATIDLPGDAPLPKLGTVAVTFDE